MNVSKTTTRSASVALHVGRLTNKTASYVANVITNTRPNKMFNDQFLEWANSNVRNAIKVIRNCWTNGKSAKKKFCIQRFHQKSCPFGTKSKQLALNLVESAVFGTQDQKVERWQCLLLFGGKKKNRVCTDMIKPREQRFWGPKHAGCQLRSCKKCKPVVYDG